MGLQVTQAWVDANNRKPDRATSSPSPVSRPVPNPRSESPLEALFLELWTGANGPELVREARLIEGRRFRCDFVHETSKTVIECEGYGIGHFGRDGFNKDAEKYLLLLFLGYTVVRLTKPLIIQENVGKLIDFIHRSSTDTID